MLEGYKVLVTVGTTAFNSLIMYLDEHFWFSDALFQIGPSTYLPKRHTYIRYQTNLEKLYENYDIIISHAGAGTVYSCLEKGKKLIVAPNFERIDSHQSELAGFLQQNNYALVVNELNEFNDTLQKVQRFTPNLYVKEPFFGGEILKTLIDSEMKR